MSPGGKPSLTLTRFEAMDGMTRTRCVPVVDKDTLEEGEELFRSWHERKVILTDSREEDTWKLSNELHTYQLQFSLDEDAWEHGAGEWADCSQAHWVECMKMYVLILLGSLTIPCIQDHLREIRKLASLGLEGLRNGLFHPAALTFLALLPGASITRDEASAIVEDRTAPSFSPCRQRKLPSFSLFFRFDRELDAYWERASPEEKRRWFPIRLWWKITSILPLRPTEFLLTPYNCLTIRDGQYFLTIRRTALKKGRGRRGYRIDSDYKTFEYIIPVSLAAEILDCQRMTKPDGTNYLFGGETWFSYAEIAQSLQAFTHEELHWPEEERLHLGDTRHLAMVSLILSGGSPSVCKALADHEDIFISSHYFTNYSELISSAVYDLSRRGGERPPGPAVPRLVPERGDLHKVPGGQCDFAAARLGDVSECIRNCSPQGHLGDCSACIHFYPSPDQRFAIARDRKEAVDNDAAFVIRMIDLVRKGKGSTESIQSALARLQSSARKYAALLLNGQDGDLEKVSPNETL